ncbi:hypothetical protein NIES3804_14320 [Microcystis aeruginosa NIES-3804]|uniref:Uncharacterized protein n=1 Tax=Microcystis aeruginosa NIES-3804 TaxID=2517783 RepID=A0A6H9FXP6_MICAE|nr:hypothetical protein [Microcystis aeruginosa]GCL49873.1 hypothetical protein NIES3804_14320 [Microcystis aeruginosa NIES-3804]
MIEFLSSTVLIASQLTAIAPSAVSQSYTLTGSIQVLESFRGASFPFQEGNICFTDRGFNDISSGRTVSIKDANNTIAAIGKLGEGRFNQSQDSSLWTCTFKFSVPNVPESPFYTISVGGRKPIALTLEDLKARNWILEFTLSL